MYLIIHLMLSNPFYLSKQPEIFPYSEEIKLHIALWTNSSELDDTFQVCLFWEFVIVDSDPTYK